MLGFIKKKIIALLSFSVSLGSKANVSKFKTFIFLINQPCMTRPTLIDLNPDEYNHGLRYYAFMVNLDSCHGSCNTLDGPSDRICVPNKNKSKK